MTRGVQVRCSNPGRSQPSGNGIRTSLRISVWRQPCSFPMRVHRRRDSSSGVFPGAEIPRHGCCCPCGLSSQFLAYYLWRCALDMCGGCGKHAAWPWVAAKGAVTIFARRRSAVRSVGRGLARGARYRSDSFGQAWQPLREKRVHSAASLGGGPISSISPASLLPSKSIRNRMFAIRSSPMRLRRMALALRTPVRRDTCVMMIC